MATIYSLICSGGSSGSYWQNLGVDQRLRYGASGSERVYSGMGSCLATRGLATTESTVEHIEIADAFDDEITSSINYTYSDIPAYSITIETRINGVRSAGFHGGDVDHGYCLKSTGGGGYYSQLYFERSDVVVDGLRFFGTQTSLTCLRFQDGYNIKALNNIGSSTGRGNTFWFAFDGSIAANNLLYSCGSRAFYVNGYAQEGTIWFNNSAIDCGTGFYGAGSSTQGSYFNNLAFGCDTNWSNAPNSPDDKGMSNNAGESGDTPWGDNSITTLVASDFVDYLGRDFRPASTSSHQVGVGTEVYFQRASDITDAIRPNYNPSGEQNWDIGCFEYDHGNGLAPSMVGIGISGIVSGSELAIYKVSDGSELVAPTTISGTSYSTTYTYTTDETVIVKIRNASGTTKYLPLKQQGVISSSGLSMVVSQVEDTIA